MKVMEKENKNILYSVLGISFLILAIFLFRVLNHGLGITGDEIKYDITGQVGDFIGGVIGTIFSGAGFYFLYVTLVEQRKSFEHESFETRFFELIRFHKENVNEMKYNKIKNTDANPLEGKKVFNAVYEEFCECLAEVKRFCKIYETEDYVRDEYKPFLINLIKNNQLKADINELALIDITYSIIYFGVGKEGEMILRTNFLLKYKDDFYYRLLKFIQLKPNRGYKENFRAWEKFKDIDIKKLKIEFELIGKNKKNNDFKYDIDGFNIMENYKKMKYYGGHQHRLGHYFRHLFQTYKFLILQENLSSDEKYFFGKTLRAQLSNYEQSVIFINSISSFGYSWELNPEKNKKGNSLKMITTFQLIKNVTGRRVLDVNYKDFYKNIKFEFENINYEQR
jgi:uncharacterized membrane protein